MFPNNNQPYYPGGQQYNQYPQITPQQQPPSYNQVGDQINILFPGQNPNILKGQNIQQQQPQQQNNQQQYPQQQNLRANQQQPNVNFISQQIQPPNNQYQQQYQQQEINQQQVNYSQQKQQQQQNCQPSNQQYQPINNPVIHSHSQVIPQNQQFQQHLQYAQQAQANTSYQSQPLQQNNTQYQPPIQQSGYQQYQTYNTFKYTLPDPTKIGNSQQQQNYSQQTPSIQQPVQLSQSYQIQQTNQFQNQLSVQQDNADVNDIDLLNQIKQSLVDDPFQANQTVEQLPDSQIKQIPIQNSQFLQKSGILNTQISAKQENAKPLTINEVIQKLQYILKDQEYQGQCLCIALINESNYITCTGAVRGYMQEFRKIYFIIVTQFDLDNVLPGMNVAKDDLNLLQPLLNDLQVFQDNNLILFNKELKLIYQGSIISPNSVNALSQNNK